MLYLCDWALKHAFEAIKVLKGKFKTKTFLRVLCSEMQGGNILVRGDICCPSVAVKYVGPSSGN